MSKIILTTSKMPIAMPAKDLRRSCQLLKLANVLVSWSPVDGDSIRFTAAAFGDHKPCIDLNGQMEKNARGKSIRKTSEVFSNAIVELSSAGLSQIFFGKDQVRGDVLGCVFRKLVESPYNVALPYLIEQGFQFVFQDPISWLFMLGKEIPRSQELIEKDLSTRGSLFASAPNLHWQQYQWLQDNFPLPKGMPDKWYAEQIMNYPMQDMEKTESIELLAFRAMQLSVLFTAQRFTFIKERFGFQPINICNMEGLIAKRKQILSLKETGKYAANEETFILELAEQNALTEFEQELQDIRRFLWFIFTIANKRRVESDRRIPGLVSQAQDAVSSAQSLSEIMDGKTGYLVANVRQLIGDIFESKLKYVFSLSHPHLGEMLFEDPPKFTPPIAQLP